MKVTSSKSEAPLTFTPVSITLTMESLEEVNALHNLTNLTAISSFLPGGSETGAQIRRAIEAQTGTSRITERGWADFYGHIAAKLHGIFG
jgi:hypothetical protein